MEGHRPFTQYVQPMDLKGFLIQYFKHLLNVIKQLGPLKHSTEMSQKLGFTVFTPRLVCESEQSHVCRATILFSNASEMNLAVAKTCSGCRFETESGEVFHCKRDTSKNQQRTDEAEACYCNVFL